MKSGDLQKLVLKVLQNGNALSVRDILEEVNIKSDKKYAYTTISTTLVRLEKQEILQSIESQVKGRKLRLFQIRDDAPKREARMMLEDLVSRYGKVGIKHLGDVINIEFSDDELEELKQELQLDETEED